MFDFMIMEDHLVNYLIRDYFTFKSYQIDVLKIDNKFLMSRLKFLSSPVNDSVTYHTQFETDSTEPNVICCSEKGAVDRLIPFKVLREDRIKSTAFSYDSLISRFQTFADFTSANLSENIEFGDHNDSLLYYLAKDVNKNCSILSFEVPANDSAEDMFLSEKTSSSIYEVLGFHPNKLKLYTPKIFFVFEKPFFTIKTSSVFVRDGQECLRVFIDHNMDYHPDFARITDISKAQIKFYNKANQVYFEQELKFKDLLRDKNFVEPYFEIVPIPKSNDEIYTSEIALYLGEQLYDHQKSSYIRQININLNIQV